MKSNLFTASLLTLILLAFALPSRADETTDPAVEAAKSWLKLVDSKKYQESWVEAAPFFKGKVKEESWIKMVAPVRDPMGDLKTRELISAVYTKTLPGAPEGEYVVIQFKTAFQNKPDAVETITPMKDDKGAWRVSGYYIR
ncbi:MAG: DUF4019 domain-containing protein [Terrimicrobiaceae bacterium]